MKLFFIILGVLLSLGAVAVPVATRYVNQNGPDWMRHVPGEIDPNGFEVTMLLLISVLVFFSIGCFVRAAWEDVKWSEMSDPKTDQQIVDDCNSLARLFYSQLGYQVEVGYRFDSARNPQERGMWNQAVSAYLHIEGTDPDEALANLE